MASERPRLSNSFPEEKEGRISGREKLGAKVRRVRGCVCVLEVGRYHHLPCGISRSWEETRMKAARPKTVLCLVGWKSENSNSQAGSQVSEGPWGLGAAVL